MSNSTDGRGDKPCYGPPMSPAIFQAKWMSKFEALITNAPDIAWHPERLSDFLVIEACDELLKRFPHLVHFRLQAQELGLQKSDFPNDQTMMTTAEMRGHEATIDTANPFIMESRISLSVHWFLDMFKHMKHGTVTGGLRWQDLRLATRQSINDLLELRTDWQRDGRWSVSVELQETLRAVQDGIEQGTIN